MDGVVWGGGSVTRASEFNLQRIQILKKTSIIILALLVTEILT